MPSYKLYYFPLRARGELTRLIFAAAGKEYQNEIIPFSDWPARKSSMPTGQLPVLEVDGEKLCQSLAIARYIAKEFGLAGKTNLEQAKVDQVAETISDLLTDFFKYAFEKDTEKKEELKKKTFGDVLKSYATKIEGFLEQNSSKTGYFVGSSLTMADLAVYEGFTNYVNEDAKALSDYKKLEAHRKMVESNKALKSYLETRPKTNV